MSVKLQGFEYVVVNEENLSLHHEFVLLLILIQFSQKLYHCIKLLQVLLLYFK